MAITEIVPEIGAEATGDTMHAGSSERLRESYQST